MSSVEFQDVPGYGTATANGDGTVTYASNGGFVDTDSFTYTVRDLVTVNEPPNVLPTG